MILVLMSSYNGEKYIEEQIESLLAQEGVDLKILVRDDGSTDSTLLILQKYKTEGKIDYYIGENIGWRKSFFDLMFNAPESDYYAFCDQDDYWLPEKLKVAIDKLNELPDGLKLYESNTTYWKNGELMGMTRKSAPLDNKYYRHLFILGPGCTYVFNRDTLEVIKKYPPNIEVEHDVWIQRTVNLLGNIYYDMDSHILYRQHGNNEMGATINFKDNLKRRFSYYKNMKGKHPLEYKSKELLNCYCNLLPDKELEICTITSSYRNNIFYYLRMVFSSKFNGENITRTIGFKLRVLLRHI